MNQGEDFENWRYDVALEVGRSEDSTRERRGETTATKARASMVLGVAILGGFWMNFWMIFMDFG